MTIGIRLFGAAAFVAASLFAPRPAPGADLKLVCAHDQPTTPGSEGYFEIQWQHFKKTIEEKSKGRVEVQVIGAGQLGDTPQLIQNMKLGTVHCTDISAASAGPYLPELSLVAVPYLVENLKHRALLLDEDRPLFAEIKRQTKATLNAHAMGTTTSSVRSICTSKRPIKTPDDLVGLKIRTMQSKAQVEGWKALGAIPAPVAFQEVYAAIQTGAVDGAENSPMFFWNMKHFEVSKYYSLTNHLMNIGWNLIDDRAFQKVPAELRDMVLAAGREAAAKARAYDAETDAKFMKQLVAAGIVVNEVDTAPFVTKVGPVHEAMAKELNAENVLKIVRDEAAKARTM